MEELNYDDRSEPKIVKEDMSKLKEMITSSPIHGRVIDLKTYLVDEDLVIVEGKLRDDRYQSVYDLTGDKLSEGPIHHLALRLLIRCDSMKIEDAEAEMIKTPHKECSVTLKNLRDIVGLEVKGGFVKKVMGKIGGAKGCAHLTRLLTLMSQEVFQGITVKQRKRQRPVPKTVDEIPGLEYLLDSCKMWEKGGFKVTRLRNALENSKTTKNPEQLRNAG